MGSGPFRSGLRLSQASRRDAEHAARVVSRHLLEMIARVNGEEWSRGTTADMMWSPGEIIAYVSQFEPTVPGEVIGSGTVGGGSGSDLGRRLAPGDEVELEVTGLGRLRNRLANPQAARWWPESRERPQD